MAGTYTDVPSRRMAYDDDGSRGFVCTGVGPAASGFRAEITTGLATWNNQDTDGVGTSTTASDWGAWLLFPELRELDGIFACGTEVAGNATIGMVSSADTTATNPFGPAWTQKIAEGSTPNIQASPRDNYRTQILSMAETSERGVAVIMRGAGTARVFQQIHVYGTISPGETPDKILVIDDATGLEFTGPLDYGDIPRGGSEDRGLRLRNDSASLTATTVQYTVEALGVNGSGGYGGGNGWFTATLPGGSTYQATRQIASIAAATTTGLISLRRITPGTEEPRLFAPRLQVQTASWS